MQIRQANLFKIGSSFIIYSLIYFIFINTNNFFVYFQKGIMQYLLLYLHNAGMKLHLKHLENNIFRTTVRFTYIICLD